MELAVKRMGALGNGFNILQAGSKKLVQSVPLELNTDHMTVMALAQEGCFVTKPMLLEAFSWPADRIAAALVCPSLSQTHCCTDSLSTRSHTLSLIRRHALSLSLTLSHTLSPLCSLFSLLL